MRIMLTIPVFLLAAVPMAFPEENVMEMDFSDLFEKHEGTVVVYDATADRYFVHNRKRSETRFTPFSTFKIPNSLIALETGILKDTDTEFFWDTTKYPPEEWWPQQWNGTHTMRTAITYSVVPFYREIATRVGGKRMKAYVTKFRYGNADISSGNDNFWLNGSLAISAWEQIDFLVRFYGNALGVGKETTKAVKDILVQEKGSGYTLSAKTGGGSPLKDRPDRALGWYVGYVEKEKNVWFFALNIEGNNFADIKDLRIDVTRQVLKRLKIIE
ncbi:MAG: class D beta-lactamase [Chitinispirillaceae bacterium]|nr:class D beta-lactamase [Chitinispirillaceae bacterium]